MRNDQFKRSIDRQGTILFILLIPIPIEKGGSRDPQPRFDILSTHRSEIQKSKIHCTIRYSGDFEIRNQDRRFRIYYSRFVIEDTDPRQHRLPQHCHRCYRCSLSSSLRRSERYQPTERSRIVDLGTKLSVMAEVGIDRNGCKIILVGIVRIDSTFWILCRCSCGTLARRGCGTGASAGSRS